MNGKNCLYGTLSLEKIKEAPTLTVPVHYVYRNLACNFLPSFELDVCGKVPFTVYWMCASSNRDWQYYKNGKGKNSQTTASTSMSNQIQFLFTKLKAYMRLKIDQCKIITKALLLV